MFAFCSTRKRYLRFADGLPRFSDETRSLGHFAEQRLNQISNALCCLHDICIVEMRVASNVLISAES